MDEVLLKKTDRHVKDREFSSRSQFVQIAIAEKLERLDKIRLAQECAKLTDKDRRQEQVLADEGLALDFKEWPEY